VMGEKNISTYYGRIFVHLTEKGPQHIREVYRATVSEDTVAQFNDWHMALNRLCTDKKVVYQPKSLTYAALGEDSRGPTSRKAAKSSREP
jgi:hypothetical protein